MRIRVKEVREWMKSLDENKWRKTYNVDARRVAHFAKNMMEGSELVLPTSLQRKVEGYEYKREKKMAKEYVRVFKKRLKEQKQEEALQESIKVIIGEEIQKLNETLSEIDAPEMAKVAKKYGFKIKLDSKRKVNDSYIWDFDVLNNNITRIKISNAGGKADTANVYSGKSTKNGIIFKDYKDLFSQMKELKESTKNKVRAMIKEIIKEENEYQEFFKTVLDKFKVKSPAELSDEKKKEFFNYIEKFWTKEKDHKE